MNIALPTSHIPNYLIPNYLIPDYLIPHLNYILYVIRTGSKSVLNLGQPLLQFLRQEWLIEAVIQLPAFLMRDLLAR